MQNNCVLFVSKPVGELTKDTFRAAKASILHPFQDNEVLLKVLYVSVDPAMRRWMNNSPHYVQPLQPGEAMRAHGVGEVLESNSKLFQKGDLAMGILNWQEYALVKDLTLQKLPADSPFPLYTWLGAAGVNGLTAYIGMITIGKLKAGDTVLVSAAAGATGSVAGQIAKIYGCRVVGTAGTSDKCKFLTQECGFDVAINYKASKNMASEVAAACPDGIDLFFDNVGGEILDIALKLLKTGGRIVLSGGISQYDKQSTEGPRNYLNLILKNASMAGFVVLDYKSEFPSATAQLVQWIIEGKIQTPTQIVEGIEQAPEALLMLFKGENTGKVVVKVA